MALAHPTPIISAPAMGAIRNCPNEPPALTMPVAMPRLLAGINRAVAAINTAGPAIPAPPAASTPMAKIKPAVVVMNGVMKVPSATRLTPTNSTRPAPTLSAIAPAKGWVKPHHSCPKANARLMLPKPSPVEVLSELKNRPMVWRVPMVKAKQPAAASRTSHTAMGFMDFSDIFNSGFHVIRACVQQIQRFVDQHV